LICFNLIQYTPHHCISNYTQPCLAAAASPPSPTSKSPRRPVAAAAGATS
jgi:hypothetical protein